MKKILVAFGTRPEIIKLAPVIQSLSESGFEVVTLHTGQHDELATEMLQLFEIVPSYNLQAMRPNQDLFELTTFLLPKLKETYLTEQPDAVIVQGDTTSSYLSALAAFYLKIPVYHVEAGLRSHDLMNPFPEEMNRKQISTIADKHFAPTEFARENLINEGYASESIWVTGNTVVDALHSILNSEPYKAKKPLVFNTEKVILVTSHRRENRGKPLADIMDALIEILAMQEQLSIVFPAHPSPAVQEIVNSEKYQHPRLHILKPLGYIDFLSLIHSVDLILTDSGGIQEEAAALGKSLIVLRETTERQELVNAGFTKLVGSDSKLIVSETLKLLKASSETKPSNVYGDGTAAKKISSILNNQL